MEYVYSNRSNTINGSRRNNNFRKNKLNKIFQNVILLVIVFILISLFFSSILGKNKLNTKTIIVDSGTTLWNIANEICEDNQDLNAQNVIIDIKQLNNLKSSIIYENQKLLVYEY